MHNICFNNICLHVHLSQHSKGDFSEWGDKIYEHKKSVKQQTLKDNINSKRVLTQPRESRQHRREKRLARKAPLFLNETQPTPFKNLNYTRGFYSTELASPGDASEEMSPLFNGNVTIYVDTPTYLLCIE
jgi:hypothetical protein